jgi:hypothetical protein
MLRFSVTIRSFLSVFILIFSWFTAYAQEPITFAKRLPSTCFLVRIIPTNSGYFAIGGCSGDSLLLRPFALKLNKNGGVMWRKEYSFLGPYWGNFEHVFQLNTGHYILTGTRHDNDTFQADPFILKLTPSGNIVWKKNFHASRNDYLYSGVDIDDGSLLFAGSTESFASANSFSDGWVLKLSASGEYISSRIYKRTNGSDADFSSIVKVKDGFLLIGSSDFFTHGPSRGLIVKTDTKGALKWGRTYFKTNGSVAFDTGVATDNQGAVIGGQFASDGSVLNLEALLLRVAASGTIQWKRAYGTSDQDWAFSVNGASDGGFVMTGITNSPKFMADDALLLKVNAFGKTIWKRIIGTDEPDQLDYISPTLDDGFIASGNFAGVYPVIFKLNSLGLMQGCNARFADADLQAKNPQISVSNTSISGGLLSLRLEDLDLAVVSSSRTIGTFCGQK